jgi:uncharacterized protein YyaL (SSP411 family)
MPATPPADPRPTDVIRRQGNRLRDEPSLYLRQHAHNPVEWFPWGAEALARAAAFDRPIFLSVGYSSCHWCHVMEKEAFDDDGIADFLNRHFVCIKVDREERPDLDAVYMDAVQALSGHGGWPMSAFLTPDGLPFHGGTYFPPEHFRHLVEQVARLWRERPQELREQAAKVAAHVATVPEWAVAGGDAPDDRWLATAASRAADLYDDEHGGFSQRQKFPTPVKWRFLLQRWRQTGDSGLRAMLVHTLETMAGRGLRDHLGGGFHRYTVDPAWTVPHFEKMLYDNAQLASLYLEAGAALERPDFTAVARDTLAFLCREMRDPAGGFFASFDADSGGHEGSYYVWSPAEITAVVGPADGPAVSALLGVTQAGNFEDTGSSVLSRRLGGDAAHVPGTAAANEALFERHRPALLAARALRTPPGLDRKVVTGWNGLAIAALARGSVDCGEPAFAEAAATAADFLLTRHLLSDGTLRRASSDGQAAGEGIIDDYACLADGLLELFLATGRTRWLAAAVDLAAVARKRFAHPEGGWCLTAEGAEAPLGRTIELFDSVVPTGSAVMLQVLLKLAAVTGETGYADEAAATLSARAGLLERGGLETAGWLQAAALALAPPFTVVVAGAGDDAAAAALAAEARRVRPAQVLTVCVPAGGAGAELAAIAPSLAGKQARSGQPTAYVCRGRACAEPVQEARALGAQLGG